MNKTLAIEEAIRQGLGHLSEDGALIVNTGKYTGRATQERFIVRRPETEKTVNWGNVNRPVDFDFFRSLSQKIEAKIQSSKHHEFRGNIGGYPLEVRSLSPWHTAFAENMFRGGEIASFMKTNAPSTRPITIWHDPHGSISSLGLSFQTDTIIALDPIDMKIVIVGTAYAGEIKKSAFSMCNYHLPDRGILSMHASANCLKDGTQTCVLFGLSGTGKTTLSASHDRYLIGDDEIIWTPNGISNLENGCYAKLIDLSPEKEPEIFQAVNRFGSIAENVEFDPRNRRIDFTSRKRTENTRGSYPLSAFEKVFDQSREAQPPRTIVFLTADAFGALPPVAKLDLWQAQYHFLSGYTAKVAGTEIGVKTPTAAFSSCFGEPFMPRNPTVYAKLLAELARKYDTSVWLLNTGWTRGGVEKGFRFPLHLSRQILSQIQSGELEHAEMVEHPVFGFKVPVECQGVDPEWLQIPSGDHVTALAEKFVRNMEKFSGTIHPDIVRLGGPRASQPHSGSAPESVASTQVVA